MRIEFTVHGNIRGQGRPRASHIKGFTRLYEDERDKDNKRLISIEAMRAMENAGFDSPIPPTPQGFYVYITSFLPVPNSWSKKKRDLALGGKPQRKPDLDNLAKAVLDALTGICFRDDTEVTKLTVEREWIAEYSPMTKIQINWRDKDE